MRMKEKIIVNTNHGKIIRMEDTMFGGVEYIIQHPNKDLIAKTKDFNEAMSILKEYRQELKVW